MKDEQGQRRGLSRRTFLKAGALGGASLLLPWGAGRLAHAASPALTKFVDPLPIPRTFRPNGSGVFVVGMKQFKQEIHSEIGPVTVVWGFGDRDGYSTPGPTFEARSGQLTRVQWRNLLASDPNAPHYLQVDATALAGVHGATNNRKAVVHLHGGHVTEFADGHPEGTILPGQSVTYDYNIDQQAATLWYHDHALGNTRLNVYMGLAGLFLVRDAFEVSLIEDTAGLPDYQYDIPIVLQDRRVTSKGRLAYARRFNDTFFGDVMLVNGKAWPHLEVERRQYRFRLLNGSNTRNYTLQLGDGSLSFQQIGSDGGFLEAPVTINRITLTPGERADVIVDFAQPGLSGGDDVVLMNVEPRHMGEFPIPEVMQFRVQPGDVGDPVVLPAQFRPIPRLQESEAVTHRQFKLEDVYDPAVGDAKWMINGQGFEDIVDVVQNGTVEVWDWVNKSDMVHPMHIHLVQAQVIGRYRLAEDSKGRLVPGQDLGLDPGERGWKDTVRVGGKELVRVIARFDGKASGLASERFPLHCHVLEHEDHEMMLQYRLQYA